MQEGSPEGWREFVWAANLRGPGLLESLNIVPSTGSFGGCVAWGVKGRGVFYAALFDEGSLRIRLTPPRISMQDAGQSQKSKRGFA